MEERKEGRNTQNPAAKRPKAKKTPAQMPLTLCAVIKITAHKVIVMKRRYIQPKGGD